MGDMGDLTLNQIATYLMLGNLLGDAILEHGTSHMYSSHDCSLFDASISLEDVLDTTGMPDFDADRVEAFLAYEGSALAVFSIFRRVIKEAGFPVEPYDPIRSVDKT